MLKRYSIHVFLLILIVLSSKSCHAKKSHFVSPNELEPQRNFLENIGHYFDIKRRMMSSSPTTAKDNTCVGTAVRSSEGENNNDNDKAESKIVRITNLPTKETTGVETNMLQLCATISSEIYNSDISSAKQFQNLLTKIPGVKEEFSDLNVRFFQKGATFKAMGIPDGILLNPPTFTAIITGSTLILGWRGTKTIRDIVADAMFRSKAPWPNVVKGLQVQSVYYDLVEHYFDCHAKDVSNYVTGQYMKNKNKRVPKNGAGDGTKIKNIILTGHSLGGGLAQVAHLFLTVPSYDNTSKWYDLSTKVTSRPVDVCTIAFSAPMTTVIDDENKRETKKFLQNLQIGAKVRNVIYNADIVPRGYGNTKFIDGFFDAFQNDKQPDMMTVTARKMADAYIAFFVTSMQDRQELLMQAKKYCHIGKLIYYDNHDSKPTVYVDKQGYSNDKLEKGERSFYDLQYGPKEKVANTAFDNHMFLVNGPGLSYAKML